MEDKGNSGSTAVDSVENNPSPGKKSDSKAKSKTQKAKPTHPPASEMVIAAIKGLQDRKGSSIQAIKKHVVTTYNLDAEKITPFIKRYLKSAVASGAIIQTKGKGASGSFKLPPTKTEPKPKVKAAAKPAKKTVVKETKKSVEKKTSPKKAAVTASPKKAKPAKKPVAEKKKPSPAKSPKPAKSTATETAKSPAESKAVSKTKKTAKAPAAKTKTPKPKKAAAAKGGKATAKK